MPAQSACERRGPPSLTLVRADQLVPIYPTLEAALADTPAQASTPDPGLPPPNGR
jgi:hypothetical protein